MLTLRGKRVQWMSCRLKSIQGTLNTSKWCFGICTQVCSSNKIMLVSRRGRERERERERDATRLVGWSWTHFSMHCIGDTSFINGENILYLVALSNYYAIHSLKEVCGEILSEVVNDDNLCYLLEIVENFDVKSLELACCNHIAENAGILIEDNRLNELKPSIWAELLKSDALNIKFAPPPPHLTHLSLWMREELRGNWTTVCEKWVQQWHIYLTSDFHCQVRRTALWRRHSLCQSVWREPRADTR